MLSEDKRRNARTEIVKPRYFILSSKTLFRYETNILLRDLKFKPTHKSNIQNYTPRVGLAEFYQDKEGNDFEETIFEQKCTFIPPRNRDRYLDQESEVLNNLNLEVMEEKSNGNLFNMDQKQLSKVSNNETMYSN